MAIQQPIQTWTQIFLCSSNVECYAACLASWQNVPFYSSQFRVDPATFISMQHGVDQIDTHKNFSTLSSAVSNYMPVNWNDCSHSYTAANSDITQIFLCSSNVERNPRVFQFLPSSACLLLSSFHLFCIPLRFLLLPFCKLFIHTSSSWSYLKEFIPIFCCICKYVQLLQPFLMAKYIHLWSVTHSSYMVVYPKALLSFFYFPFFF